MIYTEFLRTPFWQKLRLQRLAFDACKCRNCGSKSSLDVHHRFYRSSWFDTQLNDLLTLCRDCHKTAHLPNAGKWFANRFQRQIKKAKIKPLSGKEIKTRNRYEKWAQSAFR